MRWYAQYCRSPWAVAWVKCSEVVQGLVLLGLMMKELCSKGSRQGPHHPMSSHDVERDSLQFAWKHLSCFGMSSCFKYSLCLHFDCSYALKRTGCVCLRALKFPWYSDILWCMFCSLNPPVVLQNQIAGASAPDETIWNQCRPVGFIISYLSLYHFTCLCTAWIFV